MKDFFETILLARKYWEKKWGILIVLIILNVFLIKTLPASVKGNYLIILYTVANIFAFIIWVIMSKRFIFRGKNEMVLTILVSCDEVKTELNIRKVIKKTIAKIKNTTTLNGLKIVLLPINLIEDDSDKIEKFWKRRASFIDGVIHLRMNSGHFDKVDMMLIENFGFIGDFNGVGKSHRIFYDNIDLANDLSLTKEGKDWKYIYLNDGNDKVKIRENLYELILHYTGIYSILRGKDNLALDCLKTIFKPEDRKVKMKKKSKTIEMKPKAFISGRIAGILINLYSKVAIKYVHEGEKEKCLKVLMECEDVIKQHKYSFSNYITIARMNYELGNILLAKEYNEKAYSVNPSKIQTLVNKSWFSIIDGKPEQVAWNFNKLIKRAGRQHDVNWVDIVAFYEKYKVDYLDKEILVDFGRAVLYKKFLKDDKQSDPLISNLLEKTQGNKLYLPIYRVLIGGQMNLVKQRSKVA